MVKLRLGNHPMETKETIIVEIENFPYLKKQ